MIHNDLCLGKEPPMWHDATRSISTPPWMGCQSIAGLTPSIKFAGTHLHTWVERATVRVKCLAQEHNTMSPTRARTRTARSEDKRTNHEATALPNVETCSYYFSCKSQTKLHCEERERKREKETRPYAFWGDFIAVDKFSKITNSVMNEKKGIFVKGN